MYSRCSFKLRFFVLALLLTVSSVITTAEQQDSSICPDGTTSGECVNPDHGVADVVVVEKEDVIVTPPTPEDPKCPSRPHIIRCAAKYLDTNKNNKLDRLELETAIDNLPWLARGVLKIIGSVNSIMKKCDYDGDDAISIDYDMDNTVDICLATCFKRRAFKNAFFADCDA